MDRHLRSGRDDCRAHILIGNVVEQVERTRHAGNSLAVLRTWSSSRGGATTVGAGWTRVMTLMAALMRESIGGAMRKTVHQS